MQVTRELQLREAVQQGPQHGREFAHRLRGQQGGRLRGAHEVDHGRKALVGCRVYCGVDHAEWRASEHEQVVLRMLQGVVDVPAAPGTQTLARRGRGGTGGTDGCAEVGQSAQRDSFEQLGLAVEMPIRG